MKNHAPKTVTAIAKKFVPTALRRRFGLQHAAEPTLRDARAELAPLGVTIRSRNGGEYYCVALKGQAQPQYQATTVADALVAGKRLAAEPELLEDDLENEDLEGDGLRGDELPS